MSSAKAWGIDDVRLVTPAEVKELVPFIDESVIVGGFYSPGVARRRLAAVRDDRARARRRVGRADRGAERRGARPGRRARRDQARAHRPRRRRGRDRRHLQRRLEPAARADGGRLDPADAGRPPDDRHRPRAAVPLVEDGGRLPDRPRHGHEHVRAPGRAGARGRLVRAPRDPALAGRDPVDRGVGALADRAAIHAGRLHAPDGAGPRADAGDRRRRERGHQVRDQRPAVADARRAAAARRDAGGARASGRPPPSGSRKGPGVGKSVAEWLVHGQPEIDLQSSDIARFYPCQKTVTNVQARAAEGFNKTYGIVHPAEQWESNRGVRLLAVLRAGAGARRRLLRDGRLGAPALVRVEREAAGRVRRPHQPARGRVGVALVVADHQRGASGDARPRRDVRPDGVLHLRRPRPGSARVRAARRAAPDGRARSARSSTRRC